MRYYESPAREAWVTLTARPAEEPGKLMEAARDMFEQVGEKGDKALLDYSETFDGVRPESLVYTARSMEELQEEIDPRLQKAIRQAYQNIHRFHTAQKQPPVHVETMEGVECWQEARPIEKVGLYIPGGTAPLFSTILMLAIPAQIAGCREIALCTPPSLTGEVNPVMQFAARLCDLDRWYTIGGMQAVAALSLGTETVPQVDKIFGPGNQYVTAGKQYALLQGTAIDMPAGPSELLVLADETANPAYVAADLLSQAEHGIDSQVVLVSLSEELARQVESCLHEQIANLPRREIAYQALENSKMVYFNNRKDALDFVNAYAPEHLIINTAENDFFAQRIAHAGSVFLGPYSPESAGDYATGTNHTLPTSGFARTHSGVNLQSFTKTITFQRLSAEGLRILGPQVELMAAAEQLDAHKNAVTVRLQDLRLQ